MSSEDAYPERFQKAIEACTSPQELRAWYERSFLPDLDPAADNQDLLAAAWDALAEYGRHFDPEMVRLLENQGCGIVLAQNEHLTGEAMQALAELSMKKLTSALPTGEPRLDTGRDVIERLIRKGVLRSDSPEMRRLWECWEHRALFQEHKHNLAYTLLADPYLTAEQVHRLAATDVHLLSRAVLHPSANLAVWRLALEHPSGPHWMELAKHPAARHHPEIRPALREQGETLGRTGILFELARDYLAADFALLLGRLFVLAPRQVAVVLRDAPEEIRRTLTREDLLPWLASPYAEHRLAAIAALPDLTAAALSSQEPRPSPSPLLP